MTSFAATSFAAHAYKSVAARRAFDLYRLCPLCGPQDWAAVQLRPVQFGRPFGIWQSFADMLKFVSRAGHPRRAIRRVLLAPFVMGCRAFAWAVIPIAEAGHRRSHVAFSIFSRSLAHVYGIIMAVGHRTRNIRFFGLRSRPNDLL